MKTLTALMLLLLPLIGSAQSRNLAQFVTWQPKPGMEKQFEEGYKKHLEWHRDHGDTWNWYGWFFLSGPRAGQFMDATIDHAWGDFDSPVDPAGDRADNQINTVPYADFQQASKLNAIPHLSSPGKDGLKSKYLKMITMDVVDDYSANFRIQRLKNRYSNRNELKFFVTYKTVDGGRLNNWYILIGADSWADLEQTADAGERLIDSAVFKSVLSETLIFRADMSRFP